jgi:hypothetical protein
LVLPLYRTWQYSYEYNDSQDVHIPSTHLYGPGSAAQRGYEIVHEYTDRISGAKARRPGWTS